MTAPSGRRWRFGLRMLFRRIIGADRGCPYCGTRAARELGRKHLIMSLLECGQCGLRFRWPKDSAGDAAGFYRDAYRQAGLTTDLPGEAELAGMLAKGFAGSGKDFSVKLGIVKALVPSGRILDYGCSWGYGIPQMKERGFDAVGYEVAEARARYGRTRLNATIASRREELTGWAGSCDAVFSSHVFEHLRDPRAAIEDVGGLLKPEGIAFLFVPNADGAQARRLGVGWGPMTGEKHPLSLTATFLCSAFREHGFTASAFSDPFDATTDWARAVAGGGSSFPDGDELLVIARRGPCAA